MNWNKGMAEAWIKIQILFKLIFTYLKKKKKQPEVNPDLL